MENRIALVEDFMSKAINRMRKELSGKGATDCEVRILDDVMFCKLKLDYNPLERRLFSFIQRDPRLEAEYGQSVYGSMMELINSFMKKTFPGIEVTNLLIKLSLERNYYYVTVELSQNIEKKIRIGEVEVPSAAC